MSNILETPIDEIQCDDLDDVLQHHGIKGMKWGVRRYQNKDGSLTAVGKKKKTSDIEQEDGWNGLRKRAINKLSKLSGISSDKISDDDRAEFDWDVEGTEQSHWGDSKPLSSKNSKDVKRVSKELVDYWYKNTKNEDPEVSQRATDYKNKYLKDPEAYAKAVIEEIEHVRNLRELDHSDHDDDILYHHGIKGMKWGVRRYQNKDGSLTPAGTKRYNKEMAKLTAEKKALQETAKTRSAAQRKKAKMDKLKAEVDAMKKGEDPEESTADKRARLLKSTNAKELYENRDLLTNNELNERINRINMETQLKSKAADGQAKTGYDAVMEKMDKTANTIRKVTNLYKSVDEAYNTTANSAIGKMVAKKLGIETPKETFDFDKVMKKIEKNDMSVKELQETANATNNLRRIYDYKNALGADGKPTSKGGNNKGMSESDVEDMINRILDERDNQS